MIGVRIEVGINQVRTRVEIRVGIGVEIGVGSGVRSGVRNRVWNGVGIMNLKLNWEFAKDENFSIF